MKANFSKLFYVIIALLISCHTQAWDHGVSFGYGSGSDPNHSEDVTSGFFLRGNIMSLSQRKWYNLTLDAAFGDWETSTISNNNLFTLAAAVTFRLYVYQTEWVHMYGYASAGPGYLSEKQFGQNTQASHFAFQSTFGTGFEIGKARRVDIGLNFVHFSNAYLMEPNEGFNIYYVVTIGYLF